MQKTQRIPQEFDFVDEWISSVRGSLAAITPGIQMEHAGSSKVQHAIVLQDMQFLLLQWEDTDWSLLGSSGVGKDQVTTGAIWPSGVLDCGAWRVREYLRSGYLILVGRHTLKIPGSKEHGRLDKPYHGVGKAKCCANVPNQRICFLGRADRPYHGVAKANATPKSQGNMFAVLKKQTCRGF